MKPVERIVSKSSLRSLWPWPNCNKNKVTKKKNISPKTSKKSLRKRKCSNHSITGRKKKWGKKSACSKCLRPSRYELQDTYSQTDYNPYFESMFQPVNIGDPETQTCCEKHKTSRCPARTPEPIHTVPEQHITPAVAPQPSASPKMCRYESCSCHNLHKCHHKHPPAPTIPVCPRPAIKHYPNCRYSKREYEQERPGFSPPLYPAPVDPYDHMYRYPPVQQYRPAYRKPQSELQRRVNFPHMENDYRVYDPTMPPDVNYHHVPRKEDVHVYRPRNPPSGYRSTVFQSKKCPYLAQDSRTYCSYISPRGSRSSLGEYETTASHSGISEDSNMYIFECTQPERDVRMENYGYPNCRYSNENLPQYSQMEDIAYEQKPDNQSPLVYKDSSMMHKYTPKAKAVNFKDTNYPYTSEQDSRMLFTDVKMAPITYQDKPTNQKPKKKNSQNKGRSNDYFGVTGLQKRHKRLYEKSRVIICDACTITKKQLEVNLQ